MVVISKKTSLDVSPPLPLRGDFSSPPQIHHLPAVSSDPSSSVGRSGGGRAGDPRFSDVVSVEFVGSSTGGAVEAVVRSAWCVVVDLVPFDGDALRSFVAEIPPFPNSRFFGSVEFVKPYPAMAWRPGRNLFNKEKVVS